MRLREESPIVSASERNLKSVLQCIEDAKLGFCILEGKDQQLDGIVSNADLRREMLRNVDHPQMVSLDNMVNKSPISVNEQTTVSDMLIFLKEFDFPINYLPVVDDSNKIKGVVSFLNLVKGEL